jgi:hypothetical protein
VLDGINELRGKTAKSLHFDAEGFTGFLEAEATERERGQSVMPPDTKRQR